VPIATYDVERVLDGGIGPEVFVVISFPHQDSISNFFNDSSYKAIIPLRDRAFSHLKFYITTERI